MEEAIERLYREGKSLREIAEIVGMTHTKVRRILHSLNCTTRKYTWPRHAYRIAVKKKNNGCSYAEIARYLNEHDYLDGLGRHGSFNRYSVRRMVLKGEQDV